MSNVLLNAREVLDAYTQHLSSDGKCQAATELKSVITRFLVPAIGGPEPAGVRATKQEFKNAQEFLQRLPARELDYALDILHRSLERSSVSTSNQRRIRSLLKQVITWAIDKGYTDKLPKGETPATIRAVKIQIKPDKATPKIRSTNWIPPKPTYSLGTNRAGELNAKLQKDLQDYTHWLKQSPRNCRDSTIDAYKKGILLFLGWWVNYRDADRQKVSIQDMVPFTPLRPRRADYSDRISYLDAKEIMEERAREIGIESLSRVKDFCGFTSTTPGGRARHYDTAISVIKFLHEEHLKFFALTIDELPVYKYFKEEKMLENKQKDLQRKSKNPLDTDLPTWTEVLEVVAILKKKADKKYNLTWVKSEGRWKKTYRRQRGVATSLKQFLIVALLTLLPPDRQRFVRELELEKSLIKGLYSNRRFISASKMEDISKAKWYINLAAHQYKTGETYGHYMEPIPNHNFGDGTFFYDYIEEWIKTYRPLYEPKTNYLFVGNSGEQIDHRNVWIVFNSAFHSTIKKHVNPHALRHIYNSYLADHHAPVQVKTAARIVMKQSERTAELHYTHPSMELITAPVHEYNQELILKVFQS